MDPRPDTGGALWWWVAAAVVVLGFVGGGGAYVAQSRVVDPEPVRAAFGPVGFDAGAGSLVVASPPPRSVDVYAGLGAWVDVFDYDPAYTPDPPVDTRALAEMTADAVRTLYLQAARLDDRTPDGLVDPWRLAAWLLTAHARDVAVVGWYLPKFGSDGADLARVEAMHDFEVLGQRLDGVALDIEWTGDGIDHETRTARLLALSDEVRAAVGDEPLGAITPPPVQLEVVNEDFWPGFPWSELADDYDVWLPMSYWSFRSDASGYGDGYAYHEESVRRLRRNLGDPDARVHGIGGIGGVDRIDDPAAGGEPLATVDEVERFLVALDDTASIGGSLYDWNTLDAAARAVLRDHFGGPG